jgi:hypothetical protein
MWGITTEWMQSHMSFNQLISGSYQLQSHISFNQLMSDPA